MKKSLKKLILCVTTALPMIFVLTSCGTGAANKSGSVRATSSDGVTDIAKSTSSGDLTVSANSSTTSTVTAAGSTDDDQTGTEGFTLLPSFSYNMVLADNGFDPLYAAAYDYLSFDYPGKPETGNAWIPYVTIVDVDDSNPSDVRVYGDCYLMEFEKQDDVLVEVSGSHCPGIIHMERQGEGGTAIYTATGTMDEAFTDDDTKQIFGPYYEHYLSIASNDQLRSSEIPQVISDYVAANHLAVTRVQFSGEEPKELPPTRLKK